MNLGISLFDSVENCPLEMKLTFPYHFDHICSLIQTKQYFPLPHVSTYKRVHVRREGNSALFKNGYVTHHKIHSYKCTVPWFFVYSQGCAPSQLTNFRMFSSPPKDPLSPLSSHLPLTLQPLATVCLYNLACSGRFIQMESYSMWPLVSDFFLLA